jgi:hypothetical protein
MTFQEKMFEATADLRARAAALATAAVATARTRADVAAKRMELLKGSLVTLSAASRQLNKVARNHAVRFVKENSALAAAATKDVSALARTTYATLAKRSVTKAKARKPRATRKRAAAKAA